MSDFKGQEPQRQSQNCPPQVEMEIIARSVDLGGFQVNRILPSKDKKTVGPFVFWDQAGPGELLTGKGLDVRPHPHICLSTMTYLFAGELEHRDTLGSHQIIMPGDVNLMTAGRGIAHSERTPTAERAKNSQLFGIQSWLALPIAKEEMLPTFTHYDKNALPVYHHPNDLCVRVVAGQFMGMTSPVTTHNDAVFVDCELQAQAEMMITANIEERAIHVLTGKISIENQNFAEGQMLILKPGYDIKVTAIAKTHLIFLGGSALPEPRYLWWNFIASSKDRIEQAKADWRDGKFGKIPGDDKEFIPLPE